MATEGRCWVVVVEEDGHHAMMEKDVCQAVAVAGALGDGHRAVMMVEEDESILISSTVMCGTVHGAHHHYEMANGTTGTPISSFGH